MGVIRLLLALSVLVFHSGHPIFGLTLVDGFPAVSLFFTISGFYMAMILNEKYSSYRPFITTRLLKLFPTYWAIVLLSMCFTHIELFEYGFLNGIYLFVSNFFIVGSQFVSITYATGNELHLLKFGEGYRPEIIWGHLYIGPVWSLGVELVFYFFTPFCLTGRFRWLRLSLLPLASLATYAFLTSKSSWIIPWTYNLFLPNAYLFASGAAAYFLSKRWIPRIENYKYLNAGLCLAVISYLIFNQYMPNYLRLATANSSPLGTFLFVFATPFVFQATKRSKLDRFLGDLSYPVYLSHMFVIYNFPYFRSSHPAVVTLAVALVIELTVVRLVERYRVTFMPKNIDNADGEKSGSSFNPVWDRGTVRERRSRPRLVRNV